MELLKKEDVLNCVTEYIDLAIAGRDGSQAVILNQLLTSINKLDVINAEKSYYTLVDLDSSTMARLGAKITSEAISKACSENPAFDNLFEILSSAFKDVPDEDILKRLEYPKCSSYTILDHTTLNSSIREMVVGDREHMLNKATYPDENVHWYGQSGENK